MWRLHHDLGARSNAGYFSSAHGFPHVTRASSLQNLVTLMDERLQCVEETLRKQRNNKGGWILP